MSSWGALLGLEGNGMKWNLAPFGLMVEGVLIEKFARDSLGSGLGSLYGFYTLGCWGCLGV